MVRLATQKWINTRARARRRFGGRLRYGLVLERENYVCFDGLPYDYEAVEYREMLAQVGKGSR